jgi:hypothetical protein
VLAGRRQNRRDLFDALRQGDGGWSQAVHLVSFDLLTRQETAFRKVGGQGIEKDGSLYR